MMSDLPEWNFNEKSECTDDKDVWVYGCNEDIDMSIVNMADGLIVDDLHFLFLDSKLSIQ
jgi:hypothetical protein